MMPNQVFINDIVKVILLDGTAIDIVPGSFTFGPTDFYQRVEESEPVYANLAYMAYRFVDSVTQRIYYMSTDAVLALITTNPEVVENG
jgi:hypothetical protein